MSGTVVEVSAADERSGMFPIELRSTRRPRGWSAVSWRGCGDDRIATLTYVPMRRWSRRWDRASVFVIERGRPARREVRLLITADSIALESGLGRRAVITDGALFLENGSGGSGARNQQTGGQRLPQPPSK
jgi:hypothetical protein